MTERAPHRDRGLAAERTQLAWSRSALSLLACGAATIRGIPKVTEGHPVTGVVLLGLGGLVWLSSVPLARRRARPGPGGRLPATWRDLAFAGFGAALVGVAAFVIAAFFPN